MISETCKKTKLPLAFHFLLPSLLPWSEPPLLSSSYLPFLLFFFFLSSSYLPVLLLPFLFLSSSKTNNHKPNNNPQQIQKRKRISISPTKDVFSSKPTHVNSPPCYPPAPPNQLRVS